MNLNDPNKVRSDLFFWCKGNIKKSLRLNISKHVYVIKNWYSIIYRFNVNLMLPKCCLKVKSELYL